MDGIQGGACHHGHGGGPIDCLSLDDIGGGFQVVLGRGLALPLEHILQVGFAGAVFSVDHDHAAFVSGVVHYTYDHVIG